MGFKEKVVRSFRKVKRDMDSLMIDHIALKKSTNEWILHLKQENTAFKKRIEKLEKLSLHDLA